MADTAAQPEAKETPAAEKPPVEANGVQYKDHAVIMELAGDLDRVIAQAHAAQQIAAEGQVKREEPIAKDEEKKPAATGPVDQDAEDERRKAELKKKLKQKISRKIDPAIAIAHNLQQLDTAVRENLKVTQMLVNSHNALLAIIKDQKDVIDKQQKTMQEFVALMLRGKDAK